jgi:hypothetical protein
MTNRYTKYNKRVRIKNKSTKKNMIGGAFMEEDIKDLEQFNDTSISDKGGSRKRKYHKINKKTRKNKKHRQRGGQCYGRGVGSNSYDPNYSIYNTNMLKLFPYKT